MRRVGEFSVMSEGNTTRIDPPAGMALLRVMEIV